MKTKIYINCENNIKTSLSIKTPLHGRTLEGVLERLVYGDPTVFLNK
jgi:hypothetical protein